jgi:hypothetical protein
MTRLATDLARMPIIEIALAFSSIESDARREAILKAIYESAGETVRDVIYYEQALKRGDL